MARAAAAVFCAAVAAAGSAGCSAILDFDGPLEIDAEIGPDPCAVLEPNDSLETALAIAPGEDRGLGICPAGDHDFYKITVAARDQVVIEARFVHATGNLDLRLRSIADGKIIAESVSTDDNERIDCPGPAPACSQLAPGDWAIEVYGVDPAVTNTYRISLSVTPAPPIDAGM